MTIALGMPLADRFGRTATDLRVSLTDRCNLRCTYCMPAEGLPFLPKTQVMSAEEIARLVGIAVRVHGVRQVRFTGGEPLLRADLVDIVGSVAALEPRPEISVTTNAIGLATRARALAEAGLDRINISLDSVRHDSFAELTRRPFLDRVLDGIEAAAAAGFAPIKINAVLLRGVNDDQAVELAEWCLERGHQLRFIEQMPLDADHEWTRAGMITAAEIRERLSAAFELSPLPVDRDGAPAELYTLRRRSDGREGVIGIIASVTEPFCADCRRTRLTAEGRVRNCLFSHEETDLLTPLREGADDEHIARLWRGEMWRKRAGHAINSPEYVQPERTMSAIGG